MIDIYGVPLVVGQRVVVATMQYSGAQLRCGTISKINTTTNRVTVRYTDESVGVIQSIYRKMMVLPDSIHFPM